MIHLLIKLFETFKFKTLNSIIIWFWFKNNGLIPRFQSIENMIISTIEHELYINNPLLRFLIFAYGSEQELSSFWYGHYIPHHAIVALKIWRLDVPITYPRVVDYPKYVYYSIWLWLSVHCLVTIQSFFYFFPDFVREKGLEKI